MLKLSILLLVLGGQLGLAALAPSSVIARVNGDPILESDISNDSQGSTRDEKIQKAVKFRLLIQEAKKRGLDRAPDVQAEFNKILYKKLIDTERLAKKSQLSPPEAELQKFYEKFPLLRIRHLMLNKQTETDKQLSKLALEKIQKELLKETPFDEICAQYSQDTSSLFGGDTDFRGLHNFPEELYVKVRTLPKNKVSDPIEYGKAIHFFQWNEKMSFTSAPASYLQYLQANVEKQRELTLLKDLLKRLESNAVVEVTPSSAVLPQ